ncbi:MAG: pantoate--beta-alanine ligase [bacterium]
MKNTVSTEIIGNISDIRLKIKDFRKKRLEIGLVPTMGALHAGHETLIKRAKTECDAVIVSIFVNPIQFGPNEDFAKYPRQMELDREICSKYGVDLIFAPTEKELYPEDDLTMVIPPDFYQNKLCGSLRAGHFNGVVTVVSKLFNIITPDKAYFGQKDAQQFFIIKKMVKDLNFPVELIVCPVVRESDGLAYSSRNKYLDENARKKAPCLYQALECIREAYESGDNLFSQIKKEAEQKFLYDIDVEYFAAVDVENFKDVEELKSGILIAIAAKVGSTRLIDNLIL